MPVPVCGCWATPLPYSKLSGSGWNMCRQGVRFGLYARKSSLRCSVCQIGNNHMDRKSRQFWNSRGFPFYWTASVMTSGVVGTGIMLPHAPKELATRFRLSHKTIRPCGWWCIKNDSKVSRFDTFLTGFHQKVSRNDTKSAVMIFRFARFSGV